MNQLAVRMDRQKLWVAILAGILVGYFTIWGIGLAAAAGSLLIMVFLFRRILNASRKPDWASERVPGLGVPPAS